MEPDDFIPMALGHPVPPAEFVIHGSLLFPLASVVTRAQALRWIKKGAPRSRGCALLHRRFRWQPFSLSFTACALCILRNVPR